MSCATDTTSRNRKMAKKTHPKKTGRARQESGKLPWVESRRAAMPAGIMPKVLRKNEAAAYLRISVATLEALDAKGRIESFASESRAIRYYLTSSLDAYIEILRSATTAAATFWFSRHNEVRGFNGRNVVIPCRVYRLLPPPADTEQAVKDMLARIAERREASRRQRRSKAVKQGVETRKRRREQHINL